MSASAPTSPRSKLLLGFAATLTTVLAVLIVGAFGAWATESFLPPVVSGAAASLGLSVVLPVAAGWWLRGARSATLMILGTMTTVNGVLLVLLLALAPAGAAL